MPSEPQPPRDEKPDAKPTPAEPSTAAPAPAKAAPAKAAPAKAAPAKAAPAKAAPAKAAPAKAAPAKAAPAKTSTLTAPQAYEPPPGKPSPDRPLAAVATRPPAQQPASVVPPLHGPWAAYSVFGQRWPGPGRPASPATIGVLALAAAVAAISIPLDRGGVGWLITAIVGTAALIAIKHLPQRDSRSSVPWPELSGPGRSAHPARYGWAAATVALLGVGTIRSAGWLFVLCLATAMVTGALALIDGRSIRAIAAATLMGPAAAFRALPWVTTGLARVRRTTKTGNSTRVVATIAVSIALLVVFGTLFASADATFARILENAIPDMNGGTVSRWVFIFVVAGGVLGGAAYLRSAPPELSTMESKTSRTVTRYEWAIPLSLLVLLFAAFVSVQLAVLFGGYDHVMDTDGLTFAEYARGGFWQLLIVTGLTVVVLAGAARWAPRATTADRALIRVVLGALAVLTLVIVASALHRMNVYSDTYGLTRLRLLVALCEGWLGLVFVMILAAGLRLRAAWLPRVAVAVGVLVLLGLAAANPDAMIAERNLARFEQTGRIDTAYLAELSADATPALDRLGRLDPPQRDCALQEVAADLKSNPDDWRGWSYGRVRARALLADHPVGSGSNCSSGYRY